jgi:hypothetical protein
VEDELSLDGVDEDLGDKFIGSSCMKHTSGIKEKGRK